MTHRPRPNSLDTKFQAKRLKLNQSEQSKTNCLDGIHSNHRQDIGKVSYWDSAFFCIHLQVSITYKVFILTGDYKWEQNESMAMKYMNRFAIREDDQFEIHVKDYKDQSYTLCTGIIKKDFYKAAKEVMLQAQQGSGYYSL